MIAVLISKLCLAVFTPLNCNWQVKTPILDVLV